ncbi:MAG: hypothetical protein IPL33_20770 [Sphingobacteriales bacterium]|nr:hypothetical protein [Sphingobacteriales bacterium]
MLQQAHRRHDVAAVGAALAAISHARVPYYNSTAPNFSSWGRCWFIGSHLVF